MDDLVAAIAKAGKADKKKGPTKTAAKMQKRYGGDLMADFQSLRRDQAAPTEE